MQIQHIYTITTGCEPIKRFNDLNTAKDFYNKWKPATLELELWDELLIDNKVIDGDRI